MGRQIKTSKTELAYIAGFLDGDGSIMVQIKNRKDGLRGWRLMFTICFYQDTRHEKPLFWIRDKLNIGYISRRNDGMTELRINGYEKTKNVLEKLYSYTKFKRKQVEYVLEILKILKSSRNLFKIGKRERNKVANLILKIRKENYQSGSKKEAKLKSDLKKILEM